MITEKEIIEILNEWEFGANLKNGEFVRGVKNEYYKNVARAIVSKNESLHLVMIPVTDVIKKFNGTIDDSEFAIWLESKQSNES